MRLAIGTQLGQIGFVLLRAEVASMHLLHEKQPLLLGKGLDVQGAISMLDGMGASEAESTGVARIAHHFEHSVGLQRHPMALASMRTRVSAAREEHSLFPKASHAGPG